MRDDGTFQMNLSISALSIYLVATLCQAPFLHTSLQSECTHPYGQGTMTSSHAGGKADTEVKVTQQAGPEPEFEPGRCRMHVV